MDLYFASLLEVIFTLRKRQNKVAITKKYFTEGKSLGIHSVRGFARSNTKKESRGRWPDIRLNHPSLLE